MSCESYIYVGYSNATIHGTAATIVYQWSWSDEHVLAALSTLCSIENNTHFTHREVNGALYKEDHGEWHWYHHSITTYTSNQNRH